MGLTIEVAHIVRKPPNPPAFPGSQLEAAWYEQRWGLLGRICEQFGWRRVPWAEPGERAEPGRASFGRGRYHDLLRRAALEARFPHLTSRQDDGYLALYLPVALPAPVVIDAGSGFHSWGR
ncbi:MAG TPA: hypothetical protein VD886_15550, partial [Herpetosiphonaceae bacterium]|nr:hypothetical protein [Herpetosiphonaceae bacterium]